MGAALWAIALMLGFALLIFSTYAGFVGFAGVLSGASYLQCPRCHHHYLAGRGGSWHRCPHGAPERVYQLAWARLHHPKDHPTHTQTRSNRR